MLLRTYYRIAAFKLTSQLSLFENFLMVVLKYDLGTLTTVLVLSFSELGLTPEPLLLTSAANMYSQFKRTPYLLQPGCSISCFTPYSTSIKACLQAIFEGTSYLLFRLAFHRYTKVTKVNCTLTFLRSSTPVKGLQPSLAQIKRFRVLDKKLKQPCQDCKTCSFWECVLFSFLMAPSFNLTFHLNSLTRFSKRTMLRRYKEVIATSTLLVFFFTLYFTLLSQFFSFFVRTTKSAIGLTYIFRIWSICLQPS